MSEKPEGRVGGSDAWAEACAEDLRAERERRRERRDPGGGTGSAAEELRRLASAVADRLGSLQGQAQLLGAAEQVVRQARAAVEPVIERNPEVFRHLSAAGSELLAAYRSAVQGQERRWTTGEERPAGRAGEGSADRPEDDGRGDGPAGGQRIDVE
ncbi:MULTISPECIES: DUF5304 family protein [Streptomyces]|uniref:DUF5304 family protein n=1 Tax=Streptomyces TaxID=1883 RepID=UPI001408B8B3|nr:MULTISPECIES: DUF5304 family protein [Streptomyces]MDH6227348.1 hypothetical protein [Streptomyces sp. MJP52]